MFILYFMFYPKVEAPLKLTYTKYSIFSEIVSASAMSSVVVSNTYTVLRPVPGLHDLLLPILREHVSNSVCSLFFRCQWRA